MRLTRRRAVLAAAALAVFAALAAGTLYLQLRAARLAENALTDVLGMPVSVGLADVGLATGINLYSIKIANPPGCVKPYLLEIKSINVYPDYRELLRGNKVVDSIFVYSPSLDLERGAAGAAAGGWNFQPMLDHLKGRPPSRFTIGRLTIKSGKVSLPGHGYEFTIPEIKTTAISNIEPAPTGFSVSVGDGRGLSVSADGRAEVFGVARTLNADVKVEGENIGAYIKTPGGVNLEHATATARVGADASGESVTVALDLSVTGIKSSYYKGRGWLDARLSGRARYDMKTDALALTGVTLDVPGVTRLAARGTVKDVKGRAVADFSVVPSPVELARLGPYLPAGVELSGRLILENIRIRGSLRPVRLSAEGGARVSSVSAAFTALGGAVVRGIGGGLSFRLTPDGALSADADLDALGGGVAGEVRNAGGVTDFRLDADGLDVSGLGGRLSGLAGRVKAKVEGSMKGRGAGSSITAKYRMDGTGLAYKDIGNIGTVAVEGDAAREGNALRASGTLLATGGAYKDYRITRAGAGYSFTDGVIGISGLSASGEDLSAAARDASLDLAKKTASINGLAVSAKGLTASADRLELRYTDDAARITVSGGRAGYKDDVAASGLAAEADAGLGEGGVLKGVTGLFSIASLNGYGVDVTNTAGKFEYDGEKAEAEVNASVFGAPFEARAKADLPGGNSLKNPWFSAKVVTAQLPALAPLLAKHGLPAVIAGGTATFAANAEGADLDSLKGTAALDIDGLGLDRNGKPLLRGLSCGLRPEFTKDGVTLPESELDLGGSFTVTVSAKASLEGSGWDASGTARLPETDMLSLQEGVLEALPPALKWADVTGTASADMAFSASKGGRTGITGGVRLSGVTLDMPDKGIRLGPVDGSVPIKLAFGGEPAGQRPQAFRQEEFEREGYPALLMKYSARPRDAGLTIKKASYGFVEIDDIVLKLAPGDGYYEVPWFGFSAFGAKGYGYAMADYGAGKTGRYAVSLLVDGFSLTGLCDAVPGIKGYISGRVDGLTRVLVTGAGVRDVSGAGMFWAVEDDKEDREISKEFLKKLIGPSMKKFMYVGDRSYDTGELDIIFSDGDLVFDNLLLSHTYFFGYRDLHVTVAPVSNKISIGHLLEVIKDVKARAGK
ncbi:MAG: hypothetical protein HZC51_01080 [Nitrospirae bacterium]|nr:hypothetical protein [Nitrospirota bacterium]